MEIEELYYKKIFIKSEKDLPKELITLFFFNEKTGEGFNITVNPLDSGCMINLLKFNWYLKPVADLRPVGREEIIEKLLMDATILFYKISPYCIEKDNNLSKSIHQFLFSLPDRYWYCPTCDEKVHGVFVTFDEKHDPKHGCGNSVICKFKSFDTELSEPKDGVKEIQLPWSTKAKDYVDEFKSEVKESGQNNVTDEEIEDYANSCPGNTGNFMIDAGVKSGFIVGAKWLRSRLQPAKTICVNCDELKSCSNICMDCVKKIVDENMQPAKDSKLTDEEIEQWAEIQKYRSDYIWDMKSLIEGAKAALSGQMAEWIKNLEA